MRRFIQAAPRGTAGDRGCYDSLAQLLRNVRDNYADVVAEVNVYELLDQATIQGPEGHFGLMYDLARPKPPLDLLTRFAQPPATAAAATASASDRISRSHYCPRYPLVIG